MDKKREGSRKKNKNMPTDEEKVDWKTAGVLSNYRVIFHSLCIQKRQATIDVYSRPSYTKLVFLWNSERLFLNIYTDFFENWDEKKV